MVNPFICGSFHHQDEDDFENLSPCSTPKRSKRNLSRTRSSNNNNPYANRGLDKFSALLADLEDKKQKIYSQVGPDDISFVRFVFSPHSNDVKPIVVKLKDKKQPTKDIENKQTNETIESLDTNTTSNEEKEVKVESKRRLKKSISWNLKMENLKKPMFYLPLTIILILVFLAIYGRSFAIMCTSIGWYLIPTIRGSGNSRTSTNTRKPKRKKEYTRRFSERSVVTSEGPSSPTSVMNGPIDKLSTSKHGHRSSWS